METSETPQRLSLFGDESQFYQRVFPASQLLSPGSDEALQMTVGSGHQLSMLLSESGPLGAFSKILMESSVWANSEEYCYVWQILDTKFECSAFQLMPLVQNIGGTESSLWQTPVTTDSMPPHSQADLDKERSWRPPTEGRKGRSRPNNLRDQVAVEVGMRLWPTPDTQRAQRHGSGDLRNQSSGSLNPRFVEELMGYEIDHTALKLSETQLSHNKLTRSSKRSRKPKE